MTIYTHVFTYRCSYIRISGKLPLELICLSNDLLLQKWETEYKKGFSKPLILFTLAEVGRSYPYLLTKKIMEFTSGLISIAGSNIYPILTQLEKDDLIVSQPDENNRKFYKISANGKEFLRRLDMSIKEFTEMMLEIANKDSNRGGQFENV